MIKTRFGPDGIHLFDRNTGTNILIDEVIPARENWTNSPRQVSIALTNACDLDCIHCYAPKKAAKLDYTTLKKWMLELDQVGCFGIGFGGGEPTLYPQFEELCRFGKDNTSLAITMTTHGHNLKAPLVSKLKESIDFIRVSMDGVGSVYEKIRGRSFSTFLEKLQLLKGEMFFGINFVVNETTVLNLDDAVEIATEYQASEILFIPEEGFGKGTTTTEGVLYQLQEWLKTYNGNMQLSISSIHKDLVDTQLILPYEPEENAYIHIDANGVLKRSSFDKTGKLIGSQGVMDAFNKLNRKRVEL